MQNLAFNGVWFRKGAMYRKSKINLLRVFGGPVLYSSGHASLGTSLDKIAPEKMGA